MKILNFNRKNRDRIEISIYKKLVELKERLSILGRCTPKQIIANSIIDDFSYSHMGITFKIHDTKDMTIHIEYYNQGDVSGYFITYDNKESVNGKHVCEWVIKGILDEIFELLKSYKEERYYSDETIEVIDEIFKGLILARDSVEENDSMLLDGYSERQKHKAMINFMTKYRKNAHNRRRK